MSGVTRVADRLRALLVEDGGRCACHLDGKRVLGVCGLHWHVLAGELRALPLDDLAHELGFARPTPRR